jgi:hypothetical protein
MDQRMARRDAPRGLGVHVKPAPDMEGTNAIERREL